MMRVALLVGCALAVVSCGAKRRRERQARELAPMFAEIRMREEAYRVELGRYLSTGTEDEPFPPTVPGSNGVPVGERPRLWKILALKPPFENMFCQYVVVAGAASDAQGMGPIGKEAYGGRIPAEDWYYAIARCDGDGDPAIDAIHVMRSDSPEIFTKHADR